MKTTDPRPSNPPVPTQDGGGPGGRSGANDNCTTPTVLTGPDVIVAFDLSLNTTGAQGQNNAVCNFFSSLGVHRDEWFRWVAPSAGMATVETCGLTAGDTKIAVYSGFGCPASNSAIACNDDFCSLQTRVTWAVTSGSTYTIQLGRFDEQAGFAGSMHLIGPGVPPNNSCAAATAIGDGTFPYTLVGSTNDSAASCGFSATSPDVWYRFTAPGTGATTVSTCGQTAMDSVLAVFSSCGGAEITCNDDACGVQSSVTFAVIGGTQYLIRVAGFNGEIGAGNIVAATQFGNDDCNTPQTTSGSGPFAFDNTAATQDGPSDSACLFFGSDQIDRDLWFCWTAPCGSGDLARIQFCGQTTVDTKVAVFDGCGCPVSGAIACNDDSCGLQSNVAWFPVAGNTYTIRVGTFPGAAGGTGTFTINCMPPPPTNDNCANATTITPGIYPFDLNGATDDGPSSCAGVPATPDVWFMFCPHCDGTAQISTCGLAMFDTVVTVFDACAGTQIACNDDACGVQSSLTFPTTFADCVYIQVSNYQALAVGNGNIQLQVSNPECSSCCPLQLGDESYPIRDRELSGNVINDPARLPLTQTPPGYNCLCKGVSRCQS